MAENDWAISLNTISCEKKKKKKKTARPNDNSSGYVTQTLQICHYFSHLVTLEENACLCSAWNLSKSILIDVRSSLK